ncbi:MAG: carbon-phosphorus lyase [Armatimonadetes bacterium]|nr:carbon-phosphorus lyase [Armatimonadota bacterium]
MDVQILGTAAAEAWPAVFCHCRACDEARRRGGKDIRSRSGYMVGETIKIDYGPDSSYHSLRYGLAYERLEHLLVSHSHWDHWVPEEFLYRKPGFSSVPESSVLTLYGNEKVFRRVDTVLSGEWERHRMRFVSITPFEPVQLAPDLSAIPLLAAHDMSEACVNWLLEIEGRRFLQAHDTGWWADETWEFLRTRPLNALVVDCTFGGIDRDRGHMGCEAVYRVKQRLEEQGSLAGGCRFIATHFSHNGGWLHDDLEAFFGPKGIEVAYDGMRFPI